MIRYRAFLNNDVPHIVRLWQRQPPHRALFQPITATLLEQCVFSRLYFDPQGFLVAMDEEECRGFVHASYAAKVLPEAVPRQPEFDYHTGLICFLMVSSGDGEDEIARELIERAVEYVRQGGACRVWAGSVAPFPCFYHGLYAGTNAVGVLQSDERRWRWFQASGFSRVTVRFIYQLHHHELRPLMTREQLLFRRQYRVETLLDPAPAHWWEADRAAEHDMSLFRLVPLTGADPVAEILFSDIDPLAQQWNMHAAEAVTWSAAPDTRLELLTFLLTESVKQLTRTGIQLFQIICEEADVHVRTRLEQLGFRLVDQGLYYSRDLCPDEDRPAT